MIYRISTRAEGGVYEHYFDVCGGDVYRITSDGYNLLARCPDEYSAVGHAAQHMCERCGGYTAAVEGLPWLTVGDVQRRLRRLSEAVCAFVYEG